MKWNVLVNIRMARLALTLLATLSITLLWASPAKAGTTTINTCGTTITKSGVYTLGTNLSCASGVDGIDITASNVTLLLNSHTISGATSGNCNISNGIFVDGPSGVNVVGPGTISNFVIGFFVENSAGGSVSFTTVTAPLAGCPPAGTISHGFETRFSSNWTLLGNVVREAEQYSGGIDVFFDASQTPVGMDSHNNVIGNNVNDSITLLDNNKSNIIGNTASNNYGGIFVLGGSNNNIAANTTNNNVAACSGSVLVCSGDGIALTSDLNGVPTSGNNVDGNTSFGNSPYDMEDDSPDCGTDKWEGNHFKTANVPCIH